MKSSRIQKTEDLEQEKIDLIGKELMFFEATEMEEWDVCSSDR